MDGCVSLEAVLHTQLLCSLLIESLGRLMSVIPAAAGCYGKGSLFDGAADDWGLMTENGRH